MFSLCVISGGYPHSRNPILYSFVRQFAHAAARQGVKVTVIAPLPFHQAWRGQDPFHSKESAGDGVFVDVFRPRYISLSDRKILSWNTAQFGLEFFCFAVRHVLRQYVNPKPDALYGHFLYFGGASAVRVGIAMGISAFPMVGDGMLNSMDAFGPKRGRRHLSAATAFMTNSSSLGTLLHKNLCVSQNRIGVFPNGIDRNLFFPRDRVAMRNKHGLPQDKFLVICVAFQDLQKGPCRVADAIQGLDGVKGIFLGTGPNPPKGDNIIFNAPVNHEKVPEWLSAADVFVLPSTFEGCCNSVLEAMACGLPVIGSAGEFNDDILNEKVSIRVDPLDVNAIRNAVISLRDNPERLKQMGSATHEWILNFDIDKRAKKMLHFMDSYISQNGCNLKK